MKLECEMNDVMDVMCMYIAAVYGSSHTATHATRRVRGVCCYSNAHLEVSDRQGGITVPHVVRVSTDQLHQLQSQLRESITSDLTCETDLLTCMLPLINVLAKAPRADGKCG